nr:hypothetical protein [Bacteroidota bacterium]
MKKAILLFLIVSASMLSYQSYGQNGAYSKGDKIFMAGIGLGSFGGYGGGYGGLYGGRANNGGGFPPISASLEYGVHNSLSVGPFVAMQSRYEWSTLAIGAKGSWHYLSL